MFASLSAVGLIVFQNGKVQVRQLALIIYLEIIP